MPGPSDVFIDALVVLRPADLAAAKSGNAWQAAPAGRDSSVSTELRPYLPAGGDWRHSEAYASNVRTSRYRGTVYLDGTSGTVYLDVAST